VPPPRTFAPDSNRNLILTLNSNRNLTLKPQPLPRWEFSGGGAV